MTILPTSSPVLPYGPTGNSPSPRMPAGRDPSAAPLPSPPPLREDAAKVASPAGGSPEAPTLEGSGPPRGVDSSLWAILTREERAHFTRARELGPLTYGRKASPDGEPAPPRGVRLDVRV
ncbi:MAG: hypothetical protein EA421_14725 [Gemmatimonadales bacterium]|nr:MAG: hypothetical protein EA421_14725 [Gemmatimonadales bacterium]